MQSFVPSAKSGKVVEDKFNQISLSFDTDFHVNRAFYEPDGPSPNLDKHVNELQSSFKQQVLLPRSLDQLTTSTEII